MLMVSLAGLWSAVSESMTLMCWMAEMVLIRSRRNLPLCAGSSLPCRMMVSFRMELSGMPVTSILTFSGDLAKSAAMLPMLEMVTSMSVKSPWQATAEVGSGFTKATAARSASSLRFPL